MTLKNSPDFSDREAAFSGRFARSVLQSLKWAWAEWRHRAATMVVLALIGRTALLSTSLIVGYWADSLCQGSPRCRELPALFTGFENRDFLLMLGILILIGVLFSGGFLILNAVTGTRVAQRYHNETILRVSRAPMSFFDRNPVGRIFSRFSTDYQHVVMSIGPHLGQIASIILDLLIMTLMIALTNIWFVPLLLMTIAANYGLYRLNKMQIRKERRAAASQRAPSIAHFSATVQGHLAIRVFQRESRFLDVFRSRLHDYYSARTRADLSFHAFGLQMSIATAALVMGCGLLGVWLVNIGMASIGEVGVVITFVTLTSAFVQRLFTLVTSMEQGMAGAERLNQYLRMDLEPNAALPAQALYPTAHAKWATGDEALPQTSHRGARLVIENLAVRYRDDLPFVLNDLSFEVKAGESFGIIGRTGSGKSTLFQALLYLYPAQRGSIKVDRFSLGEPGNLGAHVLSLESWRNLFSYVSQDPAIFRGSLLENLVPEGSTVSSDEARSVLHLVGLGDWFSMQANGLQTRMEEAGGNLSAGQRQLLATARCLLRDAPIVLMDEATSSIDPVSEEAYLRSTETLLAGRTKIIIAHRLSTVESCDRLLWLSGGKAKMIGTPHEVLDAFEFPGPRPQGVSHRL